MIKYVSISGGRFAKLDVYMHLNKTEINKLSKGLTDVELKNTFINNNPLYVKPKVFSITIFKDVYELKAEILNEYDFSKIQEGIDECFEFLNKKPYSLLDFYSCC